MAEKSEARQELEARAKELGVQFAGNIGDAKLAERISAAEAEVNEKPETAELKTPGDQGQAGAAEVAPARDTKPDQGAEAAAANGQQSQSGGTVTPAAKAGTITVTGPKQGRWRAGRHFGPEPIEIPLDELTEDQIAAIEADPRLISVTTEA
ncbi:MAG: hypothetical protein ACP5DX_04105 [Paracoccaceae bacterium]